MDHLSSMRSVGIFISHGWYVSELYGALVQLLNSYPGFKWHDLSIPKDRALAVWVEGDEQRYQDLQMCRERRNLLQQKLNEVTARVLTWERWLSLEALLSRERERILDRGFVANVRRLEAELAARTKKGDLDATRTRLEFDLETQTALEADITRTAARIDELKRRTEDPKWRGMGSVPSPLSAVGKIQGSLINENWTLSLALANRILEADVMLVVGHTFALYRKWVEFEFESARFYSKRVPIVGLVAPGQSTLPREIRDRCDRTADWAADAIVGAIRSCLAEV